MPCKKENPGWKAVKKKLSKKRKSTKRKRRNPSVDETVKAISRFESFHEGDLPYEEVKLKIEVPEVIVALGEMIAVEYCTHKGGEVATWRHEFDKPPILATDSTGRLLFIVGGNFKVKEEGITG